MNRLPPGTANMRTTSPAIDGRLLSLVDSGGAAPVIKLSRRAGGTNGRAGRAGRRRRPDRGRKVDADIHVR